MSDRFLPVKIVCTGLVTLVLLVMTVGLAAQTQESNEKASLSVVELQQQRLELLEHLETLAEKSYLRGEIAHDDYVMAQQRVVSAKLELSDDRATRLELLNQSVQLAETLSKVTEEQYTQGDATQREVLTRRVDVLSARIRLQQERDGKANSAPTD